MQTETVPEPPSIELPRLDDHKPYRDSLAVLARLNRELRETEQSLEQQATRRSAIANQSRRAELLLDGQDPDRIDTSSIERDEAALQQRRRDLRHAIELGTKRSRAQFGAARAAALKAPYFAEVYRPAARRAAQGR